MGMKGLILLLVLVLVFPAMAKKNSVVRKSGQVCTTCRKFSNGKIPVIAGKAYCSRKCFVCANCRKGCRKHIVMGKNIYCSQKCVSQAKTLSKARQERMAGNNFRNVAYNCNAGALNECAVCNMELSTREKKNGMVCRRCVKNLHRQGMPQKSTAGGRKKVTVTTAVVENTAVKRDKEPAAKFNAFTPAVNRNKNTVAKPAVKKTAVNRNKNYNTGKPVETPAVVNQHKKYQTVKPVETPAVVNQHKKNQIAKPVGFTPAVKRGRR